MNALSNKQKEQLKMMFVEGKWLYNDILNWSNENKENTPWNYVINKIVKHKDRFDNIIESEFNNIGSQVKCEVQRQICTNIRALSTHKKKGDKVGKLKFISELKKLHVPQINKNVFIKGNSIKIPNVKKYVKINGLDQFINIKGLEIACFDIINKNGYYYICFCTYTDKKQIKKKEHNDKTIGIDFGCSNSFTTSEGVKYDVKIRESDRLKRLQKQLSRMKGYKKGEKKSNNFKRKLAEIQKEYNHISNIKNDKANKLVAKLCENAIVVIQDEQLTKWQVTNSKAVQYSILGRVKARLLKQPNVVVINKWAPTTKLCICCGHTYDMPTNKRIFECSYCNVIEDRDIHAGQNMVWMYNNKVGVGRTKLTHVELMKQIKQTIVVDESFTQKHEDATIL
jgi:putative transposase